eukprot:XP_013998465.1 PREDICTED: uncharacterized protein LOC106570547 isoform X3 [Salmo salar]
MSLPAWMTVELGMRERQWSVSSAGGENNSLSDHRQTACSDHSAGRLSPDKSTPTQDDQHSWDSFKTMTPELSIVPGEHKDRMELHNKNTWDSSSANTPDTSEGDFQTEV